jgi:serpin B
MTLHVANRLFGEKTTTFEAPFVAEIKNAYGAPFVPMNFIGDPSGSRTIVNDWVAKTTEKRITDLLPEGAITGDTRLVLANAIYFDADWSHAFESHATQPLSFATGGETHDVPAMRMIERERFYSDESVRAIELPYKGGSASMLVVLPEARDGLTEFEANLTPERIDAIAAGAKFKDVSISLPKFDMHPGARSLKDTLEGLGMKRAFGGEANFTGMSTDPKAKLALDDVFHKAFIKVDEKGTEAAASTAVLVAAASAMAMPTKVESFVADHPFLFFVRDQASGAILFAGRVDDPTAR